MASKIKVDQIEGSTSSTITLPSGQTLDLSSGSLTLPDGAVDLSTAKVTGTIPVSKGGTGLTSLGTAGQALKVNSGATGLEFGAIASASVTNHLFQTTFTGASSVAINNTYINSTYDDYKFVIRRLIPSASGSRLEMYVSSDNGSSTAIDHKTGKWYIQMTAAGATGNEPTEEQYTSLWTSQATVRGATSEINLYDVNRSDYTYAHFVSSIHHTSTPFVWYGASQIRNSAPINYVSFAQSTGTIDGIIDVYGIKRS